MNRLPSFERTIFLAIELQDTSIEGRIKERLLKASHPCDNVDASTSMCKWSDDGKEVTPVPIPNTEVKLSGAENTWLVTARKDREMPTQSIHPYGCITLYSSIAQSVVATYIKIPDTIHWFEDTKSENFGGASIALRAMSALGYQNDNLPEIAQISNL